MINDDYSESVCVSHVMQAVWQQMWNAAYQKDQTDTSVCVCVWESKSEYVWAIERTEAKKMFG